MLHCHKASAVTKKGMRFLDKYLLMFNKLSVAGTSYKWFQTEDALVEYVKEEPDFARIVNAIKITGYEDINVSVD